MCKMKGIIFDLDGVLCSTDIYHYRAWKEAVAPLGINVDESINNKLRGVSREQSLEIILKEAGVALTDKQKREICDKKNAIYVGLLSNLSIADLSENVLNTLLGLKACGIKIAVGSSSKNTRIILSALGISDLFDAVADGNEITKSKPDPEVFLKAAKKLNLSPSDCAVVEDAVSGIEAAKRGGFYAIAISDACNCPLADKRIKVLSDILI